MPDHQVGEKVYPTSLGGSESPPNKRWICLTLQLIDSHLQLNYHSTVLIG